MRCCCLANILAGILFLFAQASWAANSKLEQHIFYVNGIDCPFCAQDIINHFKKFVGVLEVKADLQQHFVTVYAKPGVCFTNSKLRKVFKEFGFSYQKTIKQPAKCIPHNSVKS